MNTALPNFKELNGTDGKIYGRYNKVASVNPYKCHFVAYYPDGSFIKGNNLFETGWDNIPQGLSKMEYVLSTGHVIQVPKFKAYMPLIEVSKGTDGSMIFHAINIKCMTDRDVIIQRVILKQDQISKYKIGDIILARENLPAVISKSWKYTA